MISNSTQWKAWAQSFPAKADKDAPYKSPFSIVNKGSETEDAEILLYDQIGRDFWSGEGWAAKDFAEKLKEIDPKAKLIVGINSPGGNVDDGLAILAMLQRRGNVVTRNDGMAASIASVILQGGEQRESSPSAMVMIHKAWGIMAGNADEAQKFAEVLAKHDQVIAETYARRSGKDATGFMDLMAHETWFTGEEAKQSGLVDSVIEPGKKNNLAAQSSAPSKPLAKTQPVDSAAFISASAVAVADGQQTAAKQNKTKEIQMDTQTTPAVAQPTADSNKALIDAIASLTDQVKNISTAQAIAPQGAEPIKASHKIEVGDSVMDEYRKLAPGAARAAFRAERHEALNRASKVQNANTFGSSLVPDSLADAVITVAHNKLSMLSAFSQDFGTDALRPKATVQVAKATAGATAQSDATNFESGDSTLTNVAVSVAQKSVSFHISNTQLNQGYQLNQIATINANVMADTISDVVTALMLTGTYGTALTIGAAANFDSADLPPIYAAAKNYNRKNLILDGGHLAYLLPTNKWQFALGEQGAFGFDLIAENNRWTSATANTVGFICDPSAIAVASGLPVNSAPGGEFISQSTVALKNGLTVQINTWYSRSSRALWASYDVMFGAAAGDTTAAELLITA